MEVLARPPGARDRAGKAIQFALVDIDTAPDGSLFVSDHNQGIWRIMPRDAKVSLAFAPREIASEPVDVLDATQPVRRRLRALKPDFAHVDRLAAGPGMGKCARRRPGY